MKYQFRKGIAKEIRRNSPEGDAMMTGITVMLGVVLAMAVFDAMLHRSGQGRMR